MSDLVVPGVDVEIPADPAPFVPIAAPTSHPRPPTASDRPLSQDPDIEREAMRMLARGVSFQQVAEQFRCSVSSLRHRAKVLTLEAGLIPRGNHAPSLQEIQLWCVVQNLEEVTLFDAETIAFHEELEELSGEGVVTVNGRADSDWILVQGPETKWR